MDEALIRENFYHLQQKGYFTDIEIEIGEQVYRCHKIILSSQPGYFYDLFSNSYKESNSRILIRLPDKNNVFKYVIEFMYKGTIESIPNNLYFQLFLMAIYLRHNYLRNFVQQSMNSLDSKSTFNFFAESFHYPFIELPTNIINKLSECFSALIDSNEIYSFPYEKILHFINSNSFKISSELDIAKFICKYINVNSQILLPKDKKYLQECVNWYLLSENEWNSIQWQGVISPSIQKEYLLNYRKSIPIPSKFSSFSLLINTAPYESIPSLFRRYSSISLKEMTYSTSFLSKPELFGAKLFWSGNQADVISNSQPLIIKFDQEKPVIINSISITYNEKGVNLTFSIIDINNKKYFIPNSFSHNTYEHNLYTKTFASSLEIQSSTLIHVKSITFQCYIVTLEV